MNVFVSQRMNGLTIEEILEERERVKKVLKKMFPKRQINIIDNITDNVGDQGDMIGKDLSCMSKADYIFFTANSTEGYKGCEIERTFAAYYDLNRIDEYEVYTDDGPKFGYSIVLPLGGAV